MKSYFAILALVFFELSVGCLYVVCYADELDISSDHGFMAALADIQNGDTQQLREIRRTLEKMRVPVASTERRALFLGYVADRFFDTDQIDEGMKTLEFVMDMPLPEDHHDANLFSMRWHTAASSWTKEMFRQERSASLLKKLQSYPPDRGCFAQQMVQSELLQAWTRDTSDEKAAVNLALTEFTRLAKGFPKRPHSIALRSYVDFVRNAGAVDDDRRIVELNRIREAIRTQLEEASNLDSAIEYLKVLRSANTELARIFLRQATHSAEIGQLSDELGSMAHVFDQLVPLDHPNRVKILAFSARQQQGFDSYVSKHAEYVGSLNRPRIFESQLLGKPCPKISGQVIREAKPIRKIASGDVILLDFWSTTCGPCIKSFPKLIELYEKHRSDGFQILGIAPLTRCRWSDKENRFAGGANISREERVRAMTQFVETLGLPWQQVIDSDDRKIMNSFDVSSYPTYVVVGRDGLVKLAAGGGDETFVEIANCIGKELAVSRVTPDLRSDEP